MSFIAIISAQRRGRLLGSKDLTAEAQAAQQQFKNLKIISYGFHNFKRVANFPRTTGIQTLNVWLKVRHGKLEICDCNYYFAKALEKPVITGKSGKHPANTHIPSC